MLQLSQNVFGKASGLAEFSLESRLQAVPARCRLKAGLQTPVFKTLSQSQRSDASFAALHPSPVPFELEEKNLELNLKQITTQTVLINIRRRQQGRKKAGYERAI